MHESSSSSDWARTARHETVQQQLDRNFGELLQEIRVAQTGVQILFAFLLTIAFAARSVLLRGPVLATFVTTIVLTALATCFLIAPVACHRVLFRRHRMARLVEVSHRLTLLGLVLLAAAVVGSVLLVLEVLLGQPWSWVVAGTIAVVFFGVWGVLPMTLRDDQESEPAVGGPG